jgi:hypothetical protein
VTPRETAAINNEGGRHTERERERERESRGATAGKRIEKKKNSNKGLTTGVGYSGRAALRRGQCNMYA